MQDESTRAGRGSVRKRVVKLDDYEKCKKQGSLEIVGML